MRTLISINIKLTIDDSDSSIDPCLYKNMISSFLYLTTSRDGICFRVGVCARYLANSKVSHLAIVKQIIHFVSGIINYGI